MARVERASPVEVRASKGGRLSGLALPYGERARDRPERFLARSLRSGLPDARLILQHDKNRVLAEAGDGLDLMERPLGLHLRAMLAPDGAEARLVARGALRGLSVGFVSLEETRKAGVREISAYHLDHVALVDSGSYRTPLEIRQWEDAEDLWLTGVISYDQYLECRCQGPECSAVEFEPGAFDDLGSEGDVLAVGGGGFSNVLGSMRRGTLVTRNTRKGLEVGLTNPETETARRVIESAKVAPIYVRPILDLDLSDFTEAGEVRRFTKAGVRAFLVKPTDAAKGHNPATIRGPDGEEVRARRRVWL